jgi:hypothetical protein
MLCFWTESYGCQEKKEREENKKLLGLVLIREKDKKVEKTVASIGKTEKMCKFAIYIVYAPKGLSLGMTLRIKTTTR